MAFFVFTIIVCLLKKYKLFTKLVEFVRKFFFTKSISYLISISPSYFNLFKRVLKTLCLNALILFKFLFILFFIHFYFLTLARKNS